MSARMEAVRNRQVAEVLEACADEQDKLQEVKAAHEAEQTPETLAARRQAMYEMHMFRRWLRDGRPVIPEGEGDAVVQPRTVTRERPKPRRRRDA